MRDCSWPNWAAPQRLPLLPGPLDGESLALIAVAVVQEAAKQAAKGDAEATAWLDQVRADVLELAPGRLRW
jgi:hypothetical protein